MTPASQYTAEQEAEALECAEEGCPCSGHSAILASRLLAQRELLKELVGWMDFVEVRGREWERSVAKARAFLGEK